MAHCRRNKGKDGIKVSFTPDMPLTTTKELFLSNKENKQKFVDMLGAELECYNCLVFHADADADFLIVQKAIESAERIDTVLIGEDTDLLVLLLYHTNLEKKDIFFPPEPKQGSALRVWNIKEAKEKLGPYKCKHILFLHAFLDSDTTSRVYGYGKSALMKKLNNSKLMEAVETFHSSESLVPEIQSAGEKVFCVLYSAKRNESLHELRYRKFCQKVSTGSTHVQPQVLPLQLVLQNFIVCRFICRYVNGKVAVVQCHPRIGAGNLKILAGFQWKLT